MSFQPKPFDNFSREIKVEFLDKKLRFQTLFAANFWVADFWWKKKATIHYSLRSFASLKNERNICFGNVDDCCSHNILIHLIDEFYKKMLGGKTCLGSFEYCHKRREDLCIRSVKNLLQAQSESVACSKTPNVNYGPSFFSYMERLLGLAPRKGRWRFFFFLCRKHTFQN